VLQFAINTTSLVYGPFFFVLSRMYGCSFLAVLNTRHHLREHLNSDVELFNSSGVPAGGRYPSSIAFASSGGTRTAMTGSKAPGASEDFKAHTEF
jgi:hypothetical protein